jgi:hypothetical protein
MPSNPSGNATGPSRVRERMEQTGIPPFVAAYAAIVALLLVGALLG